MKKVVLIMAGGRGERFWPRSRKNMPKQFLSLTDDGRTMIQHTVDRVSAFANIEDIYVSTNIDYKDLVIEQLKELPKENILCEPIGRNTAPCIGLAATYIKKRYEDALLIVLPSDHLIKYHKMFNSAIDSACKVAEQDNNLVTIGITPSYPETGYGYVKFNADKANGAAYEVDRFVEKPSLEVAKEYLETEEYLWNSGMFVWKASSILANIKQFIPDLYEGLIRVERAIGSEDEYKLVEEEFYKFPSISIDYGVLEKASNIYIVPGTFGWDDVGSWLAVERIKRVNENGNVVNGNIITIGTEKCIIEGKDKLIAAVGLDNIIIVDTDDAILICEKAHVADIKKVVENLKICNREEYI